jgi:hypothetical protein
MTYHRVINKSNTTDDTCGVGTAYHSAAHEFISDFSVVRVVRMLVLCVDLCFHCVVCPSLIYGFWLHLWYLQRFFVIDYITSIIYLLITSQIAGFAFHVRVLREIQHKSNFDDIYIYIYHGIIYTILDLFYENGFLWALSHGRQRLQSEMWWGEWISLSTLT